MNIDLNTFLLEAKKLPIIDVRSPVEFGKGHIPGAVNSTYADILTTVEAQNTNDLPVLVACYSGQSAAHAVVALRLAAHPAVDLVVAAAVAVAAFAAVQVPGCASHRRRRDLDVGPLCTLLRFPGVAAAGTARFQDCTMPVT